MDVDWYLKTYFLRKVILKEKNFITKAALHWSVEYRFTNWNCIEAPQEIDSSVLNMTEAPQVSEYCSCCAFRFALPAEHYIFFRYEKYGDLQAYYRR